MSSAKSKKVESVNKIALVPCPRCGRTPRLVEQEFNIYSVECTCGIEFWLSPAKIGNLARDLVAQEWNKVS